MTAATATKNELAALREEVEALRQENATLQESLQGQAEQAEARIETNRLQQRAWISEDYGVRKTKAGRRAIKFTFQFSAPGREGGPRLYGANKDAVAYGEIGDDVLAMINNGTNLADITCFESPYTAGDGTRRTEWVITQIAPYQASPRPAAEPHQEPVGAEAYPSEPSEDEVPF